jgi:polar amino acid transport system permease protein
MVPDTAPLSTLPPPAGRASRWREFPLWLAAAAVLAVVFLVVMLTNPSYEVILRAVSQGIWVTISVTLISYALALTFGLIIALMRLSGRRLLRETSTFYVEIVRGVPMLVILYYIAFVAAPAFVLALKGLGAFLVNTGPFSFIGEPLTQLQVRDLSFAARAILALTIGYSAFVSEIFRAGIESIERGQTEAARSLGMSYRQAMRHVILPQAVRTVLPPLGNEFIAMLKDSSLVSVLGVPDITQLGKVYAASTFRFFETYNVVAYLYLIMTVGLALVLRALEKRMPGRTR